MPVIRREIDNDRRSPTYLCETEEFVALQPTRVPGWVLLLLLAALITVARIEDVAAVAHWLDHVAARLSRFW